MKNFTKEKNIIEVKKYNWVQESLTFGYYEFEITVHSDKEETFRRRFSEIEWLHEGLLKYAPGCKISPLPEKNVMTNLFGSESVALQRKDLIQKYLNYINNHEFLSKCPYFKRFFEKNFDNEKSEIQSQRSIFGSIKNYFGLTSQ